MSNDVLRKLENILSDIGDFFYWEGTDARESDKDIYFAEFLPKLEDLVQQSSREARKQEVQNALTHITAREESPDDYLDDRLQELHNQEEGS